MLAACRTQAYNCTPCLPDVSRRRMCFPIPPESAMSRHAQVAFALRAAAQRTGEGGSHRIPEIDMSLAVDHGTEQHRAVERDPADARQVDIPVPLPDAMPEPEHR